MSVVDGEAMEGIVPYGWARLNATFPARVSARIKDRCYLYRAVKEAEVENTPVMSLRAVN